MKVSRLTVEKSKVVNGVKAGCWIVLTVAVCLFLWRADRFFEQAALDLGMVRQDVATTLGAMAAPIQRIDGAITDLDRTVLIAGGVLNVTRQIERDNRADIQKSNAQTLATLQHVDDLVVSFDASQKQAASSIEQTSAALVPVLEQTKEDLRTLEPAIEQVVPLLQQSTAIAGNLNATTADVQAEIHKFVYPPPRRWWQKYLLDPIKTAAHLITIPIGHA